MLGYAPLWAQNNSSLTLRLLNQFHQAWNDEDMERMPDLLATDAFFKSHFQLRYSRDAMASCVLIANPPVFKVQQTTEVHSKI